MPRRAADANRVRSDTNLCRPEPLASSPGHSVEVKAQLLQLEQLVQTLSDAQVELPAALAAKVASIARRRPLPGRRGSSATGGGPMDSSDSEPDLEDEVRDVTARDTAVAVKGIKARLSASGRRRNLRFAAAAKAVILSGDGDVHKSSQEEATGTTRGGDGSRGSSGPVLHMVSAVSGVRSNPPYCLNRRRIEMSPPPPPVAPPPTAVLTGTQ